MIQPSLGSNIQDVEDATDLVVLYPIQPAKKWKDPIYLSLDAQILADELLKLCRQISQRAVNDQTLSPPSSMRPDPSLSTDRKALYRSCQRPGGGKVFMPA